MSFLRRLISADRKKGPDGGAAKQHVAIIGLDAAGKTTIMKRILRSEYTLSKPTFGVNIEVYRYRTLEFVVWDLGGHAPIRKTLWKKFVTKAQIIVFVVDAADQKRFGLAKDVFYESLDNTDPNAPILFLANKSDKDDAASSVEVMEALELQKMETIKKMAGGLSDQINTPLMMFLMGIQTIREVLQADPVDTASILEELEGMEEAYNKIVGPMEVVREKYWAIEEVSDGTGGTIYEIHETSGEPKRG